MRVFGWAMGGVLCAFLAGHGGVAMAVAPPAEDGAATRGSGTGAAAARGSEDEGTPITDDVIVEVMLKTERVVHRTAAVGAHRASGAGVHDVAKRVQSNTGQMLSRLGTYAARHGYTIRPVVASAADAEVERSVNEMLGDLQALESNDFNPTFLVMMHDLCGQMLELLEGAQRAAADPGLRAMLRDRAAGLKQDQRQLELVMLKEPPAGSRGADQPPTVQ
jgi:hypothetical protein